MIGRELTKKHIEDLCARFAGESSETGPTFPITDVHGNTYDGFRFIPWCDSGVFSNLTFVPAEKVHYYATSTSIIEAYAFACSHERAAIVMYVTAPYKIRWPKQPDRFLVTMDQWTEVEFDPPSLLTNYFTQRAFDEFKTYLSNEIFSKPAAPLAHPWKSCFWEISGAERISKELIFCPTFEHLKGGGIL